jgi:quinol monooxygenase YgiN
LIHVIATVELHRGRRGAFLDEFRKVVPHVLAEPGCLEYGPAVDAATDIAAQLPPREDVVTIVEKWEGLEDLRRHLTAPHMLEYRPRVKEMIAGSTLVILTPA